MKRVYLVTTALLALAWAAIGLASDDPESLLTGFSEYAHVELIDSSESRVLDHEVGLGALQKVRGAWRFKSSERVSGLLQRFTWQVLDGYTSQEVFDGLAGQLQETEGTKLLFECEGRACGHGAQWANRVFRQRILYGRDDLQRYSVFGLAGAGEYRLVLYASARTSDRQYLHADLIEVEVPSD